MSALTAKELADLEAKAEAATPGPWEVDFFGDDCVHEIRPVGTKSCMPTAVASSSIDGLEMRTADAAFIAAANPDTVKRLLADLREAEVRVVEAEKAAEQHKTHGRMFARAADTEKAEAKTWRARAEAAEARLQEMAKLARRRTHSSPGCDSHRPCANCEHNAKVDALLGEERP